MHCQDSNKLLRKMLRNKTLFIGGFALIVASIYYYISRPEDFRSVNISLEVPAGTEPIPFEVIYYSSVCKKEYRDGDFNVHYKDDSNYFEVMPKRRANSTIHEENIALDKGGYCKWKLGSVTIGFKFKSELDILKDIDDNIPRKITLIFDEHYPPASSNRKPKEIHGDFIIEEDLYPLKKDYSKLEMSTVMTIEGINKNLMYRFYDTNKVNFKPTLHTDKLVLATLSMKHSGFKVIYPDGSITYPDSMYILDFERLEKMK